MAVIEEHPFPQALAGILRTTKIWSLVPELGTGERLRPSRMNLKVRKVREVSVT